MQLEDHELARYSRQIRLDEIGVEGQIRLKNASVLCIGAGGLGAPLLQYLAAAGVGTLGIIDHDQVESSNLQRQIIYTDADIGMKKVEAARGYLQRLNPNVACNIYAERFSIANARELISEYDYIADCTDSLDIRYLTNDVCFAIGKPFIFAGISQFHGQISLFHGKTGPCFRCLFPNDDERIMLPDCNHGGVLGVLPGVMGTLQASMLLLTILRHEKELQSRFYQLDLLRFKLNEFFVKKSECCPGCSQGRVDIEYRTHSVKSITFTELRALQLRNEVFQLIDVRFAAEHEECNIGGILIPLDELLARMNEIERTIAVIFYCHSGPRSMAACQMLAKAGYENISYLQGGAASAHCQ